MVNEFTRPQLTSEETNQLKTLGAPLSEVKKVLEDLSDIGADVSSELMMLEQTERLRSGLLERFARRPRSRRNT